MSEMMPLAPEKLWYDGPNYTADSVIFDPNANKILLILRAKDNVWALPGGFVDPGEDSHVAAMREAREESQADVADGKLFFCGIVDDPRNTETAWIETSAYLFEASTDMPVQAGDDAADAQWFRLDELPERLYASHQQIIDRALDTIASQQSLHVSETATLTPVDGGHMNYQKYLAYTSENTLFIKTYTGDNITNEHTTLLRKEAAAMSHLRTQNYPFIPSVSHMHDERTLVMEAFAPQDGWQWRAPADNLDFYLQDNLQALNNLEQVALPADIHNIVGSFDVHFSEGWRILSRTSLDKLAPLVVQLRPESQSAATRLFADFEQLQQIAHATPLPENFVLCHHDARQANIAWHPEHGSRLVDWSWTDVGRPGSDATTLLIDLHKHGHDVGNYREHLNPDHCLMMMGFWLEHASWPVAERDNTVRLQQLLSALSAYELLTK